MEPDTKNAIAIIKQELSKIKGDKDEKSQEFYTKVNTYVTEFSTPEKKEEKKEEKEDTKPEEKKEAPKKEETPKEGKKEEPKKEEKKEEKINDKAAKELSMEVSDKLKEAAIELQRLEKDIKVKDEIIGVRDAKIMELSTSLEKYHKVEQLELQQAFDRKVQNLIELYSNLGIKKDVIELKENFNEEQIDKLTIDLSAMSPKTGGNKLPTKTVRQTNVSPELELNRFIDKKVKKQLSDNERAKMLFDM